MLFPEVLLLLEVLLQPESTAPCSSENFPLALTSGHSDRQIVEWLPEQICLRKTSSISRWRFLSLHFLSLSLTVKMFYLFTFSLSQVHDLWWSRSCTLITLFSRISFFSFFVAAGASLLWSSDFLHSSAAWTSNLSWIADCEPRDVEFFSWESRWSISVLQRGFLSFPSTFSFLSKLLSLSFSISPDLSALIPYVRPQSIIQSSKWIPHPWHLQFAPYMQVQYGIPRNQLFYTNWFLANYNWNEITNNKLNDNRLTNIS